MNLWRGLLRLWIVATVLWVAASGCLWRDLITSYYYAPSNDAPTTAAEVARAQDEIEADSEAYRKRPQGAPISLAEMQRAMRPTATVEGYDKGLPPPAYVRSAERQEALEQSAKGLAFVVIPPLAGFSAALVLRWVVRGFTDGLHSRRSSN